MDLCRSCGLCCDGSLFGRVMFDPGEQAPKKHLQVLGDGRGFEQPCTALGATRECLIYDERPAACRRFVCRLLARQSPLEDGLAAVERTRELLDRVLTLGADERDELARRLEEDFARAS